MKSICKNLCLLSVLLLNPLASAADDYEVVSPNGNISALLHFEEGRMSYSVKKGDKMLVERSPLGLTTNQATEPLTVNGLTGHFVPAFLNGGHVLFQDGKAKVMEGNNVNVVSNEAYLIYGTNMVSPDVDYDLAIQLDGRVADSIKETVEKVSAKGSIYSLSGRLVKQNGTLGDMNSLAPGIYILNGVKVLVK